MNLLNKSYTSCHFIEKTTMNIIFETQFGQLDFREVCRSSVWHYIYSNILNKKLVH